MFRLIYLISIFFQMAFASELITPIPKKVTDIDPQKALLGKQLFFDTVLSSDNTVACISCHIIDNGGDDNCKVSQGVNSHLSRRNTPTVLNSRFNFVQFWDGRAKSLYEQVKMTITDKNIMGSDFKILVKKLKNSSYNRKFKNIYKNGVSKESIVDAIVEYEKSLITPNSPFDKFLRGDKNAISDSAKEGYLLFKAKGCIACHNGVNIGGNMYAKFGTLEGMDDDDLGRYEVTKDKADKYLFKVPTLRNIALTSPYMHNGKYKTLKEVVKFMAHYQIGKIISDEEIDKIVSFLETLTGELPNE